MEEKEREKKETKEKNTAKSWKLRICAGIRLN